MQRERFNYHVSPREGHQTLFSRCIDVLGVVRHDQSSLKGSTQAFLLYAASFWPFHLTQSSGYDDQDSLVSMVELLRSPKALEWLYIVARHRNLRAVVEKSKSLNELLKLMENADRNRSTLAHRLADKEFLQCWVQDLIRTVGRFGRQNTHAPKTIYKLVPAFCPTKSAIHRQFTPGHSGSQAGEGSPVIVRGKLSPMWDDLYAKLSIPGNALPSSMMCIDRYFAILTKSDRTVHLHYAATCETARRLQHGGHVH